MDAEDVLPVRFHFGEHFDYVENDVNYVGGGVEMSYLERDKVSLPELRGFLADHVDLTEPNHTEFHWLFPRAILGDGLRKLGDDKTCLDMCDCITKGGVAEIYVEIFRDDGGQTRRVIDEARELYILLLMMAVVEKLTMKNMLKRKKRFLLMMNNMSMTHPIMMMKPLNSEPMLESRGEIQ
ncbi:unnamed protein product [Urochloa humidicola]